MLRDSLLKSKPFSLIIQNGMWQRGSAPGITRLTCYQASILRQIVAGPRARHAEAGLDLCYVTDNSTEPYRICQ
jgi:hypothetical protein